MTFLKKLMIRGIRSFSPNEANVLEFYSPLTLIVGPNGTGKTSIIECLKYITTGSLPPNSKGGAFIFDPKIAKEVEVKAQVKLLFVNSYGKSLICTRSIQATQKRDKVEQKTLETVLKYEGDQSNIGITSKCADIDTEVPYQLGVNTSVLENIIFCHQEESTWPLSEPAVIKKKLDEIFVSDKYSKALDTLKSSKRECLSDNKLKVQELGFLFKLKERKTQLENDISSETNIISKNEKKLELYESEIKSCQFVIDEIKLEVEKMGDIEQKSHLLNEEKTNLKLENKKNEGKIFSEDKIMENMDTGVIKNTEDEYEKLKHEINYFEERFNSINDERIKYLEYKDKINKIKSEISIKRVEKVECEKKKSEIALFLEQNLKTSENFRKNSIKIYEKVENEITEKRKRINEIQSNIYVMRENERIKKERILRNLEIINKYKSLIDDPLVDTNTSLSEEIKNLESNKEFEILMKKSEKNVEVLQKKLNDAYVKSENQFLISQRKKRKDEILQILGNKKIDELTFNLSTHKKQLEKNKLKLKEFEKDVINKKFEREQYFKHIKRCKEIIRVKIEKIKKSKKETENIDITPFNEFNVILDKENEDSNSVAIKEKIKDKLDKTFKDLGIKREIIENFEFEKLYSKESILKRIEETNNIIVSSGNASNIYKSLLKMGIRDKNCPLCNKTFNNTEETSFENKLNNIIIKIPDSKKEAQNNRENLKRILKITEMLNSEILIRNKLKTDIITEIMNLQEISDEVLNFDEITEDIELEIIEETEKIKTTEGYIKLAEELIKIEKEVMGEDSNIENLTDIKNMIDIARTEYSKCKKNYDDHISKLNDLIKREKHRKEIQEIRVKIEERNKAEKEVEAIKNEISTFKIKENEEELALKKNKLEKLDAAYTKKKISLEMNIGEYERLDEYVKELEKRIIILKGELNQKLPSNYSVEAVDDEKFNTLREELFIKKRNLVNVGQRIHELNKKKLIAEASIRYYDNERRLQQIEVDLSNLNLENLNNLKDKLSKLENKNMKLVSQRALILGECKQVAVRIKQLNAEIEREHSDTSEKYIKCYIETKALELAINDLDKCIQSLDKAIIDFHSNKLDEINQILKYLWVETYKGTDIEWIEIKSESAGSKTYNYRVVMIKNGTEIDMRGRCSAGQKMIASILIRLALAETFAAECNVLALDEPTTNLDKDNIESLAYTLSKIISRQGKQHNFQLIVITHDEEFVQLLTRSGPEYFYRLRRNEYGESTIIRHSLYGK